MERLLNLELTSFCNANCSMCPRNKIKDFGYITLETIDLLIEKIKNYDLFEISLSGRGEPTFHPQLINILKKIRGVSKNISIVTTTDGLNENNYKECLDLIDILRISVSSIDKEIFSQIHRGLDYNKIWKNIEMIINYNKEKLNIHLVGGEATYPGIERTIEYFKNNDVNNIHLFPLWNRGGNIESQDINLFREKIVNKYNINYSEDEYLNNEAIFTKDYCQLGDTSIMINYKGEMIGCFQDFENLTKICDVTDSVNFIDERRKMLKKMPICYKCNSATMARK